MPAPSTAVHADRLLCTSPWHGDLCEPLLCLLLSPKPPFHVLVLVLVPCHMHGQAAPMGAGFLPRSQLQHPCHTRELRPLPIRAELEADGVCDRRGRGVACMQPHLCTHVQAHGACDQRSTGVGGERHVSAHMCRHTLVEGSVLRPQRGVMPGPVCMHGCVCGGGGGSSVVIY